MQRFRHPYFLITSTLLAALFLTFLLVKKPVKEEQKMRARLAAEQNVPAKLLAPVWLWRGLQVNLAVAALLVALTPLARKPLSAERLQRATEKPRFTGADKLMLAGAVVIFAASAIPRLDHSLWGDEEYLARRYIADDVEVAADGSVKLAKPLWVDTVWDYWRPTNHMGYTVVARLFHDTFFHPSTDPNAPFISERLIRLPVLLAGIAALFTLAWSCRVWGWNKAAAPVALAYAGHAWLVRFGVDARGYGFVMLLVLLLTGVLGCALQTGKWRWWLLYGVAQFYLLWTHMGTFYVPLTMNLAALCLIWQDALKADRQVLLVRWLAANLVTTLLVVGIMTPMLIPFLTFMKRHELAGSLDLAWLKDAASYMACGAPWLEWSTTNPFSTALSTEGLPKVLDIALLTLAWALAALGIAALWQQRERRGLLIFLVGGPALLMLHLVVSNTRPYHWYMIPFLPALLLLWAAALSFLWQRRRSIALVLALQLVAGIHAMAWPQNRLLVAHPIEANRDSVAVTRQITNPRHPDYGHSEITASCIMTTGLYDPAAQPFKTVAELQQLMKKADAEHKPLYVNFGFRDLYRSQKPDLLAMFDDRNLFEPVSTFPGLFFSCTREVIRYRGSKSTPP